MSIRKNYKLSRSLRISLDDKNDFVYFSGEVYNTVKEANYDYENKEPGGNHLLNKNSFVDGNYNYNGKYFQWYAAYEKENREFLEIVDEKELELIELEQCPEVGEFC